MIYQVILAALLGSVWAHPQTFQYQRQFVYNPPLPAFSGHPGLPLLAEHQNHLVAKAEPQPSVYLHQGSPAYIQGAAPEPAVYVYSPDGRGVVLLTRQQSPEPGFFQSFVDWINSQAQAYNPFAPTPEKPPTSASPEGDNQKEKPEKLEAEQPVQPVAPAATSQRFYVGQPLPVAAPAYPFPTNQFIYRTRPSKFYDQSEMEPLGDKAGAAALSFQKYLAVAKLKSKGVRGGAEETESDPSEDETTSEVVSTTTEKEDTEVIDNQELGPSIAQAKPQAVSVAGPGGVAAAAPVGTAVVGPGGMALSAPSATAVAGAKGTRPSASQAKIRAYFKQANVPGYFVQY